MAWYDTVGEYVEKAKDYYNEYKGLVDAGAGAVKGYLDYKDQKRRNELDEQAYRDYMLEVASAGQEAQSAVDINLTPMEVTNIPTSKADVTDFTALAANGGIIGLKNGGDPNAGITALRKTAPGVVDRMGFEDGTGEKGVQSSFSPLNRILEKIKDMKYKSELGRTDDGDLAERTSEYVDNNPFKRNITAIREPGESENRAMLNAMINDGLDTEETMDEASKDKIILGLVQEMFRNGDMEKDEYEMYMESYITEMQKGGIAGLRNGGRPGYAEKGFVTADVEEVVSEVTPRRLKELLPASEIDKRNLNYTNEMPTNEMLEDLYDNVPTDNYSIKNIGGKETYTIEEALALASQMYDTQKMQNNLTDEQLEKAKEKFIAMLLGNNMQKGGIAGLRNGGRPGYMFGEGPVMDNTDGTVSIEDAVSETEEPMKMAYVAGDPLMDVSKMNRIELMGNLNAMEFPELDAAEYDDERIREMLIEFAPDMFTDTRYAKGGIANLKKGGRVKKAAGGVMDLGGREKDYRFNGGFVPLGEYEKKDDVPARLSKNEFVFTADAVRAAGGGSINKGAQKMYNTMKTLEAKPQAKRMTA